MTNNFKPNKGGYRQPQLSPEEWKAKKQAEKDAVYQMIDDTATAIVQDGEKFRGFLDTQARLDRYSAANALLIYNQYPKATQLKDFGDWAEEKVSINKGAKSISILEPVEYTKVDGTPGVSYNVKKVFDVSQTKGRQTPAPTVNRDPQALVAVMIDTSPVIVEVAPELPHPQMGAFYDNEKQTLFVKKDIGDSVALCQCVAQELGHAQLSMTATLTVARIWAFRQCASAICSAKSTAWTPKTLLSTVSRRNGRTKSRRKSVRSFPKPARL